MNAADEHKALIAALDSYRSHIDEISDEEFTQTPPIGGWSYAEVYSHIMQASLGSSIAAEKCCNKTGVNTTKGLNFRGMLMFLMGRFPPVKLKAPDALDGITKKISKEEARNLIIRLRKRLDELWPKVHDAAECYKIRHPRLGMLNARQWMKFTRIHLQHHLKQINRINKSFPQG